MGLAQDAPHPGDARVVLLRPHGPIFLRIGDHRPELVGPEDTAALPYPLLRVEGKAG